MELSETQTLICKMLNEEFVRTIQTEFAKPVLGDADMNVDEVPFGFFSEYLYKTVF